jgi:hypothetical protein
MRKHTRATLAVALIAVSGVAATASGASAAEPLERVLVRTEGKTATLFEGPILTRGHEIQATSDSIPRQCDSTNNGAHAEPGPTPTASTVDGMSLTGRTFDALWYDGFGDYFVQQFGPDRENGAASAYWGILVNGVYTSVGGCQYQMNSGDVAHGSTTRSPRSRHCGWTVPKASASPRRRLRGSPRWRPSKASSRSISASRSR